MFSVLFVRAFNSNPADGFYSSRYELLSSVVNVHVLLLGNESRCYSVKYNVHIHTVSKSSASGVWGKLSDLFSLVFAGVKIVVKSNIDVVACYDPLFLGIVAVLIKIFTSSYLIVEINGHLKGGAASVLGGDRISLFKRLLFDVVGYSVLAFANSVKLLNNIQFDEWATVLKRKPCYIFHDFVPVSLFERSPLEGEYILCVGYPFGTKGVDVLLKAFQLVRCDFPSVRLLIMGHCRTFEEKYWKSLIASVPGVYLIKPVEFRHMISFYQRSLFFVLPSRTEGMGRVLVEAMACGKALIGSRVGGIPNVIQDGVNGYLFPSENHIILAERIHTLLASKEKSSAMGNMGYHIARDTFSEDSYLKGYSKMFSEVLGLFSRGKCGIVYSGY